MRLIKKRVGVVQLDSPRDVGCKTTMADMNRRNVLVGLGTAAAGSGIVFGSGAFTQVTANRDVSFDIETDDEALLDINPGGDVEAVELADGALDINTDKFSDSGDEGLNVGAEINIGDDSEDTDNFETPAFTVTNKFDQAIDLDVTLDLGNDPNNVDGLEKIELNLNEVDEGDVGDSGFTLDNTDESDTASFESLAEDDTIEAVFNITTEETDSPGEFGDKLEFTVNTDDGT